jgi:spore coat polysaccharide biosynthesis protein SpsF (cytidylyltransferase family)
MNVGIIIQSRMGSKRLPGKNLLSITKDGTSLIELVILRLKKCKKIDQIIVATSKSKKNNILVKKLKNWGLMYSEEMKMML